MTGRYAHISDDTNRVVFFTGRLQLLAQRRFGEKVVVDSVRRGRERSVPTRSQPAISTSTRVQRLRKQLDCRWTHVTSRHTGDDPAQHTRAQQDDCGSASCFSGSSRAGPWRRWHARTSSEHGEYRRAEYLKQWAFYARRARLSRTRLGGTEDHSTCSSARNVRSSQPFSLGGYETTPGRGLVAWEPVLNLREPFQASGQPCSVRPSRPQILHILRWAQAPSRPGLSSSALNQLSPPSETFLD